MYLFVGLFWGGGRGVGRGGEICIYVDWGGAGGLVEIWLCFGEWMGVRLGVGRAGPGTGRAIKLRLYPALRGTGRVSAQADVWLRMTEHGKRSLPWQPRLQAEKPFHSLTWSPGDGADLEGQRWRDG